MNLEKKILTLRISYWAGAIADGFSVIPMIFPQIGKMLLNLEDFNPTIEYQYAMGMGASLMLGWTILLIWADRKPIERRGIVLITLVPVMLGIFLTTIYILSTGKLTISGVIPQWLMMSIVALLFIIGFYNTRDIKTG